MLAEGDKALHTIHLIELETHLKNDEILITEKEIQDKSKADALSKGLIVTQLAWFILQCIARVVEGLPITHLELVTVAFATLSFVTYALWWNKPLNVECAVLVQRNQIALRTESDGQDGGTVRENQGVWSSVVEIVATVRQKLGILAAVLSPVWLPLYGVWVIYSHSLGLIERLVYEDIGFDGMEPKRSSYDSVRVPKLYVRDMDTDEHWMASWAGVLVATVFGAIHCVAWSFEFQSHMEQLLWRISAVAMTCLPLIMAMISEIIIRGYFDNLGSNLPELLAGIFVYYICVLLYILARVTLLVLPFIALRSVVPEAYQTVQWTTLIPHV
jgi:hypothetical protein